MLDSHQENLPNGKGNREALRKKRVAHLKLYVERTCPTCRRIVTALLHDYGQIGSLDEFDKKVGETNIPVLPIKCPQCGSEEFPEYALICDGDTIVKRLKIGSEALPVVGGNPPYAVVLSPEEQAELERGMAKVEPLFEEREEEFWEGFCREALARWREYLAELRPEEFQAAFQELGLELLPPNASSAAWRKEAQKRLVSEEEKKRFWKAANRRMIEDFLWDGNVPSWPVERWVKEYGRRRVSYVALHLPLPEELEPARTEKLGRILKKQSGDGGLLFERISHLTAALEKQRRRAEELSVQVMRLRQEKAELERRLNEARRQIEELQATRKVVHRDPDDVRKIREYKALIAELREEIVRLKQQVKESPEEVPEPEIAASDEPTEKISFLENLKEPDEDSGLELLHGKIVAIFGRLGPKIDVPYTVLWHEGNRADQKVESLAHEADVLVVLTRLVSHEVMQKLKELAEKLSKPISYSRETGLKRILLDAAQEISKEIDKDEIF